MNKLIPGALYSHRAARSHMLRENIEFNSHGYCSNHGDCRNYSDWHRRAAQAFRENDPNGSKLAKLLFEDSSI